MQLVGQYNTPGSAVDVGMAGNYAYVADEQYGLRVLDVSNPATPAEVGTYPNPVVYPDAVVGVAVVGDYAYVANSSNRLACERVEPGGGQGGDSFHDMLPVAWPWREAMPTSRPWITDWWCWM